MSTFETYPKTLKEELLNLIHAREMALPDFQRDFVWQPGQTQALILSLARSFPAGSLLRMENSSHMFAPRAIAGAPELNGHSPKYLILDGQQRLTSLYQALYGTGDHLFFVRLQKLIDGEDLEKVFFYEMREKGEKLYGTRLAQARARVLPLQIIFGGEGFHSWLDEIAEVLEKDDDGPTLTSTERKALRAAHDQYVAPIVSYEFPVVTLTGNPSLEAVCTIFETLNNTGVRLSVFDLLSARFYAKGKNLRQMWTQAFENGDHLREFEVDPYYLLQVIAARAANSIKRSDVLKLDAADVVASWDDAVWGMEQTLDLLNQDCGVLNAQLLSYNTVLVPMAAAFAANRGFKGPAVGALKQKLRQWYWCSVFMQTYEFNPTSQTITDIGELQHWIEGGAAPHTVSQFDFKKESLYFVTTRQRAIYRGVLCLVIRRPPLDFHTTKKLTASLMAQGRVDDHHIFPAAYLAVKYPELEPKEVDAVVNRTLIDRETNQIIGKRAPSDYLQTIEASLGGSGLNEVLISHYLPTGSQSSLRENDYDSFRQQRADALYTLIMEAACDIG